MIKFLPRPPYTPPADALAYKKVRATFMTRICATSVDVALAVWLAGFLHAAAGIDSTAQTLQATIVLYYFAIEFIAGQTPGKIMFGVELVRPSAELTQKTAAIRCLTRAIGIFAFPLGVTLMFSWKRTTLLDKITGTRVVRPASFVERKARRKKVAPNFEESLLVR